MAADAATVARMAAVRLPIVEVAGSLVSPRLNCGEGVLVGRLVSPRLNCGGVPFVVVGPTRTLRCWELWVGRPTVAPAKGGELSRLCRPRRQRGCEPEPGIGECAAKVGLVRCGHAVERRVAGLAKHLGDLRADAVDGRKIVGGFGLRVLAGFRLVGGFGLRFGLRFR